MAEKRAFFSFIVLKTKMQWQGAETVLVALTFVLSYE